jgi:hypothetical protein
MRKHPLRISTIPTLHNDEGLWIKKNACRGTLFHRVRKQFPFNTFYASTSGWIETLLFEHFLCLDIRVD